MFPKQLVSKKDLKTVYGIPCSLKHIARLEAAGRFLNAFNLVPTVSFGW